MKKKHFIYGVVCMLILILAVGCKKASDNPKTQVSDEKKDEVVQAEEKEAESQPKKEMEPDLSKENVQSEEVKEEVKTEERKTEKKTSAADVKDMKEISTEITKKDLEKKIKEITGEGFIEELNLQDDLSYRYIEPAVASEIIESCKTELWHRKEDKSGFAIYKTSEDEYSFTLSDKSGMIWTRKNMADNGFLLMNPTQCLIMENKKIKN